MVHTSAPNSNFHHQPRGVIRNPHFPAYASTTGQSHGGGQPQQPSLSFQQYYSQRLPTPHPGSVVRPHAAPPPPPPPPGESSSSPSKLPHGAPLPPSGAAGGSYTMPLVPPPLPPMFPWMSAALAESMTSSQYGQSFRDEATQLPFVPIIVNDSDLAKMTENVIKEAEQVNDEQLQYYKDVLKQDIPQQLKDLFQPLYCKLCILTLSSPVVAKDHYNGKRHKKSVDAWYIKNPHLVKKTKSQGRTLEQPQAGSNSNSSLSPSASVGLISGFIQKHYPDKTKGFPDKITTTNQQADYRPNQIQQQTPAPPQRYFQPPTRGGRTPNSQLRPETLRNKVETSNSSSSLLNGQMLGSMGENNGPHPTTISRQILEQDWQSRAPNPHGDAPLPPKRQKWDGPSLPQQPLNTSGVLPGGGRSGSGFNEYVPGQKLCQICNVQLTSQVQAEQHFKGKNHAAKVAAYQEGRSTGLLNPNDDINKMGSNQGLPAASQAQGSSEVPIQRANPHNKYTDNYQQKGNQSHPPRFGGNDVRGAGEPSQLNTNNSNPNFSYNNNRGRGRGQQNNQNNRFNNGRARFKT